MRRRGAGLAILTAGVSLLLAAPASAGTLDQEQSQHVNLSHAIYDDNGMGGSGQSVAQTFTAGISGGLDQVDLYLQKFGIPTADLTVEIFDTVGGIPVNSLATESVPQTAVTASPNYSFVPVTIDPPVPVTAGTQYAIVAWTASLFATPYYWGELNPGLYAGGQVRVQFAPNASPPTPGFWSAGATPVDMTFKTYVIPPATGTPPPANTEPTGQRAAALKKCKKKKSKKKRKKCRKRAKTLPV